MSRTLRVNATMDARGAAAPGGCLRGAALRGPLDRAAPACRLRVAGAAEAGGTGRLPVRASHVARLRPGTRLSTWQAHDLLRAEGVAVARGDRTETAQALEAVLQDLPRERPTGYVRRAVPRVAAAGSAVTGSRCTVLPKRGLS